ncbi:MAG: glycosyl hydrolase [Bacteroidota bacterium]
MKHYLKHCIFFILTVTGLAVTAQQQKLAKTDKLTPASFKNPPLCAKPKALWPWVNGNFNFSQITYEMEQASQKGMSGFDIWDVGAMVDNNNILPTGPAFLSDESVQGISFAVKEAERLNMELGLITSSSWNAGGAWIKPEHAAMGLFKTDTVVAGPSVFNTAISFPVVPSNNKNASYKLVPKNATTGLPVYYKDIATLAYTTNEKGAIENINKVVILNSSVDKNGILTWQVPEGKWHIARYVCIPTGQQLATASPASKGFVLDHFSAAAQEANMNYVIDRIKSGIGRLTNRSLKYLYEDSYEVNSGVWTPLLAEVFAKKYGYSLLPFLPFLNKVPYTDKNTTDRFHFDFTKLLSDLIIENHYAKARMMCEKAGLGFYAEAGGPGPPVHNVPFEDLKALGSLTVPRGEFWKSANISDLQVIKGIASAAHIYNQKFVEAEAFTSVWLWQEGPGELKPLADRAMCEGLNRFVYHTFPHSPPEGGTPGWIYNFGTIINTTNGWWSKSQGFHEYLGRCSYLLQEGNFRGDVAFYYGDQAPNFVAPKHVPVSLGNGYDYDVVNSDIILDKMTVKNHRIYLPHGQYYEVLVLPDQQKINPAVLKKLEKLVSAGATIIGPKPTASYSLKDAAENDMLVKKIADKLWGDCDSIHIQEHRYGLGKVVWGKTIRSVLQDRNIGADVQAQLKNASNTSVDFIHRTTAQKEIYFIRNTLKQTITGTCTFRVQDKVPEYWNAETGEVYPVKSFSSDKNGTTIPFSLPAEGSCFIVFSNAEGKPLTKALPFSTIADEDEIIYTKKGAAVINYNTTINLDTPWEVRFEKRTQSPVTDSFPKLQSWHLSENDGIKYFSGLATYYNHFDLSDLQLKNGYAILLSLNKVKEIAEVYLNGKKLGLHWYDTHNFDITDAVKPGRNYLVIEVVNSINNRLIGDAKLPENMRQMRSNITKLPNAWSTNFKDAKLIEAGLIGPVKIEWAKYLN